MSANLNKRCDLQEPDAGERGRWSSTQLAAKLTAFGSLSHFSEKNPLHVMVPNKTSRLQIKGTKCRVQSETLPPNSLVDLGNGISMSCPELMFVELARVMHPAVHLLLGMELCGRFSRCPDDARSGEVSYQVEPITSVEKLRSYAKGLKGVWGIKEARATIDLIEENAWSPIESVIATMLCLPFESYGYDLAPIRLNARVDNTAQTKRASGKESRVPDILFSGTHIGLNYDGEDHFGLKRIVEAAQAQAINPDNPIYAAELDKALADVRHKIVDDKRRDRELEAEGMTVFAISREDLYEKGAFEQLVSDVVTLMERERGRDKPIQRAILKNQTFANYRQDLIWTLLPGDQGVDAYKRLVEKTKIKPIKVEDTIIKLAPITGASSPEGGLAL
ncbi:MAG: hypothetical protein IJ125_08415 [Atopobiaceae bacterium]|nr:hypothetical protein [Atopobiaceae bacterium]